MRTSERSDSYSIGGAPVERRPAGELAELGAPWVWPGVIIASALTVNVVVLGDVQSVIRPFLVFWFLLVCPGMAFVRLLRIRPFTSELTLGLALSIALDTIVAATLLYAGAWSPAAGMVILGCLSVVGAVGQIVLLRYGATEIGDES